MAEHELPGAREVIASFGERMEKHLENLDDLRVALESAESIDEVMDDWEARRLLRELLPESSAN